MTALAAADSLAHMTADQRDSYVSWLTRLARRAKGRMREYLETAADTARDPWSFIQ